MRSTEDSTGRRWGKPYRDKRDWPNYNEQLVIRGEFYLDLDFAEHWDDELDRMNKGKRGGQYELPESFVLLLMAWKQLVDYRGLEGICRKLHSMHLIPKFPDYSDIWYRIHVRIPEITKPDFSDLEVGSDGTGLKTSNAGSYRILKYGDLDAEKRKHLVVVITADAKRKKLIGISVRIEGPGRSEPDDAIDHIRSAQMKGVSIAKFLGDGAFDSNEMFNALSRMHIDPVIKIRKNASTERHRGSKYRRRAIRKYRESGYKEWAEQNHYGMRWPGTEGIFSAVKRKFGENTVSRSEKGLLAEGYQRFWIYDEMREYGERRVKLEVAVKE